MDDIQSFIVVLLRAMNQRRLLVLTFGLAVLCMFTLWQVHIQSPESSPKAPYVNVAHEAMPSSATSAVDYQDRFGSDSFQPPKGAPPVSFTNGFFDGVGATVPTMIFFRMKQKSRLTPRMSKCVLFLSRSFLFKYSFNLNI